MEDIDTARMFKQAQARAASAVFKEMGPSFLYNALQDQLPITVLEARSAGPYSAGHIRRSIRIDQEISTDTLDHLLSESGRVVVLTESSRESLGAVMVNALKRHAMTKKVFVIKGGYEDFQMMYPFLCVPYDASPAALALTETRWPTEILRGVLYFGSAFNLMSSAYVSSLNIKSVIQLAPPLSTCNSANYSYLPIKSPQDLAEAVQMIEAAAKPVLIVDLNGDKEAAAASAVFFSKAKGLSNTAGLTYVISKRPDISLPPWLTLAVHNYGDELANSEQQIIVDQVLRSMSS